MSAFSGGNDPAEETRLTERARSGDRGAFESLYRGNAGRVYALCLRMTRNSEEAREMTQEVFIRAWQKLDAFSGRSRFSTWLHRLAVNHVLNIKRARKRVDDHETATPHLRDVSAAPPRRFARLDLERAIISLPQRMRSVLLLHDVHGYKHREIAEMLEMAEGTSKAHLHGAHKMMRERLAR